MFKDIAYRRNYWPDLTSRAFRSLHTVIFWKIYLDTWSDGAEKEDEHCLFLDHFRRPVIQHLVYSGFREDCRHLLSVLSRYSPEDDGVDYRSEDDSDEGRGGEEAEEQSNADCQGERGSEEIGDEHGVFSGPKRSAYLPHLRTIAVMPCERSSTWLTSMPSVLARMRRLVVRRKATIQPIEKLYVPAEFLAKVCAEFPVEEGLVGVEVWRPQLLSNWEMWPASCWDDEY